MQEFLIHPTIRQYDDCAQFVADLKITDDDLVLTNEYIFHPHFGAMRLSCPVLYQERYGSGEPSDDMFRALLADAPSPRGRIIAIGGGTILDLAKLLALKNRDQIAALYSGDAVPEKACPLIAVPTTCGTGSEVTNVSVLSLVALGTKKGLAHDALYPDLVALVPDLVKGLPYRFFATSSLDALIHAVESALSPKATLFSKAYAYQAIATIVKGYRIIARDGEEARLPLLRDFLVARTMAGISFGNAGCAAVHALSYPLGAKYHIAHGESNYALFMGVMRNYRELQSGREMETLTGRLSAALNCAPEEAWQALEALLGRILPHRPLCDHGVTREDLDEFADSVMENQGRLMANAFLPLDRARILKIYQELLK